MNEPQVPRKRLSYPDFIGRLGELFRGLCRNTEFISNYPQCRKAGDGLGPALSSGQTDDLEHEVVRFYCLLHSADVQYSPEELSRLHDGGGYWCYAGGLDPLYRAGGFISEECRSVDLGAGNGLQGMLLQYLYPHRLTTQVELSGRMVCQGQKLRDWMGLSAERFEWIHGDIADVSPERFDFIYMYLPVRNDGRGSLFYSRFAKDLESVSHPMVIFSIADCFRSFAPTSFQVLHSDGHLTCYSNRQPEAAGD